MKFILTIQGEVMQVNLSTTAVVGFITNLGKDNIFSVAYIEDNYQAKGQCNVHFPKGGTSISL